MTMRRTFRILIAAGLIPFLLLLAACSNSISTWDRVQSSGVLRVGLDPTYPPFEFYDGVSLHGIDVDLAKEIAAENGLQVEFSHFGFDGLYDALATEQADVLISALTPDPARTEDFAFSDGYIDAGLVLVSLSPLLVENVANLSGKSVAVELGAAGHVEATGLQRRVRDLAIKSYPDSIEALQGLTKGEADIAIVDYVTFRLYEPPEAASELIFAPLTSEPYAIVVRRGDHELLTQINETLVRLKESGSLDLILNRWLTN